MRLSEVAAAFLKNVDQQTNVERAYDYSRSINLLVTFFTNECLLDHITPSRLRGFLARWYVEQASTHDKTKENPGPDEMLCSIRDFFLWAKLYSDGEATREYLEVIDELKNSIPRALEIFKALSSDLADRGGAFGFSEFLTSFEEGGRSQYDLDSPGDLGALEGYFRVIQISGTKVEAEELITEDRRSVIFPEKVSRLLEPEYIINLEIVRASDGWRIASCGFAYPPGTEILSE